MRWVWKCGGGEYAIVASAGLSTAEAENTTGVESTIPISAGLSTAEETDAEGGRGDWTERKGKYDGIESTIPISAGLSTADMGDMAI
ncbi:MAG: hypothetical protein PUF97_06655 [Bifidobacteriaceae bacterium]|nr:hypothetical protein [Bifidobacteriaceae bacterium]